MMTMIIAAVLLTLCTTITCERVDMKIIEGLPKPKNAPNGGAAATPTKPIPSRDAKTPDPTTPHHMLAMKGHCFASNIGKYKYEVCPFENVTQLDTTARWNPFYGILGVWEGWKEDETTEKFTVGRFTDGTMCGSKARTVEVHFSCGEGEATVSDVKETETCTYTVEMHATEICNTTSTGADMGEEVERNEEVVEEREGEEVEEVEEVEEMEEVEEVEEGRTAAGPVAAGPVAMVPKVAWLSASGEAGCSRLAMSVREPPPRSSSNCATRCR